MQYKIPNRELDVFDMLANLLGTLLGVVIYYLLIEKFFDKRGGVIAKVDNT